jgi:type I restriction enzyme S subunit
MQQLLSPNGSGRAGQKRFPEFEGEPWVEVKIGDLLKEVERDIEWDDSALYDLISVKRRSEGIVHRESLYGHEIKTKNLKDVKEGDFIISRMQVLHGASALASKEFEGTKVSGSYHTLVAHNSESINLEFFNYLSQTPYLYHLAYISSHGVHIEKMTFKIDDYLEKKIKIPPSVGEQRKIANVLLIADKEIELLKEEMAAIKKQKKGLMQQLLTGKVRVNKEK